MNIDKLRRVILLIPFCLIFSGCSLGGSTQSNSYGGVLRSDDGGRNWSAKSDNETNRSISSFNVLSLVLDSNNPDTVYFGTKNKGIFVSKNRSESWEKLNLFLNNVYAIAISRDEHKSIYIAGTSNNVGKIFKSIDGGKEWKEVYTEPSEGTMITTMALDNNNPQSLHVGTSDGALFKTVDGGESWENMHTADGPILGIEFDARDETMYVLVFNKDVLISDGVNGEFKSAFEKDYSEGESSKVPLSLAVNKERQGEFYVGTANGIFKGNILDGGIVQINSLGSSRKHPIRSIAVSHVNGSERIIYGSSQAAYSSFDGGSSWSVSQVAVDRFVSNIVCDPNNTDIVYTTFRKK